MNVTILSASNAFGFYTYSQISDKKDLIPEKLQNIVDAMLPVFTAQALAAARGLGIDPSNPFVIQGEIMKRATELKQELEGNINTHWNNPETTNDVKLGIRVYNGLNILGYLPIIGTIIGIAKLVLLSKANNEEFSAIKEKLKNKIQEVSGVDDNAYQQYIKPVVSPVLKEVKSFRNGLRIRAIVETASLGCLLLIPDLIATIARSMEKKKNTN